MAMWWAKGWGWYYPMEGTLYMEGDWKMQEALMKIQKRIEENGFLEFFLSYTGLSSEEKVRILDIMLESWP